MDCEAAFVAAGRVKQQAEMDRVIAQSDYAAAIAKVQAMPLHLRPAWLRSEAFEEHRFDIELERHAIAGTECGDGKAAAAMVTILPKRPMGVRKAIVATVAEDWSKRIGRPISKSTVIRCWEELRAMQRRLAETDGNEPTV